MKILYFEREVSGHRVPHLSTIINGNNAESIIVCPEMIPTISCKQYIYKNKEQKKRTLRQFLKMIKEVKKICDIEKPDIVHFTDGNIFYRFFGAGLKMFKKYKIVLTNHNAEEGFLYKISTKRIYKNVDVVTVTSEYSKEVFERYGAKNVLNVEYPQLNDYLFEKDKSKEYFGINTQAPVLACIGGTRYDKGLDILLESLNAVKSPFHLLIAGKPEFFSEVYIKEKIKPYEKKVTLFLNFLTEEEFAMAISCADYVVVPYRKGFNGASGPLGEGVWRDKIIIGPKSRNLGDIIENHHLGYTFEQENSDSLASILNDALAKEFEFDDLYRDYKSMIDHKEFEKQYRKIYDNLVNNRGVKDGK